MQLHCCMKHSLAVLQKTQSVPFCMGFLLLLSPISWYLLHLSSEFAEQIFINVSSVPRQEGIEERENPRQYDRIS